MIKLGEQNIIKIMKGEAEVVYSNLGEQELIANERIVIENGVSVDQRAVVNDLECYAYAKGTTTPPTTASDSSTPFILSNYKVYNYMKVDYAYDVYQNYGNAYIMINGVQKHTAGTSVNGVASITLPIADTITVYCYAKIKAHTSTGMREHILR